MAFVKSLKPKIKNETHLANTLDYVTKKEKASHISYNLCVHENNDDLLREFRNTRQAFNKDRPNEIKAVHIAQSFSPEDNITPEQAHEIGKQMIEKCFSIFQVVLATHIDGNQIHNHFIINSVSPFDGKKFYDNNSTINLLRKTSDELCYKNNLSVIEKDDKSKYKPLDQATLNTAKRGTSWKLNLVKDLDEAFEKCNTKEEFQKYFIEKNYEINFTNSNITFRKFGEKKGIRADTLAKQFGMKYCKASIEKKLNIETANIKPETNSSKDKTIPPQNNQYFENLAKHEWKRYEKRYGRSIRIKDKRYFDRVLFSKNPLSFTLRLLTYIFSRSKKTPKSKTNFNCSRYKIREFTDYKKLKKIVGNISYKKIVDSPGEAVKLKLYSWQLSKLFNNNILLSSKIDLMTGTAIVTVKQFDLQRIAHILKVSPDSLYSQAIQIDNRYINSELKRNNYELNYLVVTPQQAEILRSHYIKFASYPKGENINIAFSPSDKEKILSAIYPNRVEKNINNDTFFKRNSILNKKLKEQSEATGEKLCYKVIFSNQYKALRETTIEFAVFRQKDGKYNVVFLEHNKAKIEKVIGGASNSNTSETSASKSSTNLKI